MSGRSIYDQLNVPTVINAAGTFTEFGGSLMPDEVVQAWCAAARNFVDLRLLQDRVGQHIASLLQVDAAMVTGGAASGMVLAVAAAVTLRDPDYPHRDPAARVSPPYEVIRQRTHRDLYDRQLVFGDVELVEVDAEEDVAAAVNDRTVLMAAYNVHEPQGRIRHEAWIQLARKHRLPTLLDAAADTPPVTNLSHFTRLGYDLVVFSGGKAMRGPQDTGLLLGRADLINAAKMNASPNEGVVGRVAKVTKEDMVACWAAVERYVRLDPDQIRVDCQRRLDTMAAQWHTLPQLRLQSITPEPANCFPHLIVDWNEQDLGISPMQVRQALREGTPSIVTGRVAGTGDHGLLLSAINLDDAEAETVGRRVREVLLKAQAQRTE